MTLSTYFALERDARQRYERLRRIFPDGVEIVYVISRSVRNVMSSFHQQEDVTTQFHNGEGIFGVYQGVKVFVADDLFPQDAFGQDFFEPAVVTNHYIQGMEIGDLIIGPNNRIFFLAQVVMNADGTVTSRFEELADTTVSFDCREPFIAVGDGLRAIDYAAIEDAMERLGRMSWNIQYESAFSAAPASGVNATCKPHKEESIILGDTSALDEFLNSFVRTGFLEAAT